MVRLNPDGFFTEHGTEIKKTHLFEGPIKLLVEHEPDSNSLTWEIVMGEDIKEIASFIDGSIVNEPPSKWKQISICKYGNRYVYVRNDLLILAYSIDNKYLFHLTGILNCFPSDLIEDIIIPNFNKFDKEGREILVKEFNLRVVA